MNFLIFGLLIVFKCAYGLKFQGTEYGTPFVQDPSPSYNLPIITEDFTVTVYATQDSYRTVTDRFYNTVPIIVSEIRKSTLTLPTKVVVRTPVDDVLKFRTLLVTQFPSTETVTDTFLRHRCVTEASTDLITVTHFDQRILQKTITSVLVQTITFRPTIVKTVLSTEREISTETDYVTKTIWANQRGQNKFKTYF